MDEAMQLSWGQDLMDSPISSDYNEGGFDLESFESSPAEDIPLEPNEVDNLIRDLEEVCSGVSRQHTFEHELDPLYNGSPKTSESGDSAIAEDQYPIPLDNFAGVEVPHDELINEALYRSGLLDELQVKNSEDTETVTSNSYGVYVKEESENDSMAYYDDSQSTTNGSETSSFTNNYIVTTGVNRRTSQVQAQQSIQVRLPDGRIGQLLVATQPVDASVRPGKVPIPRCPVTKPKSIQPKVPAIPERKPINGSARIVISGTPSVPASPAAVLPHTSTVVATTPAHAPAQVARSSTVKIVVPTNGERQQVIGGQQAIVVSNNRPATTLVRTTPIVTPNSVAKPITPSNSLNLSSVASVAGSSSTMNRKVERMIRNREAAALSRKRKKEYTEQLESQLRAFSAENERLNRENERLKAHVQQLEAEKSTLTSSASDQLPAGSATESDLTTDAESGVRGPLNKIPRLGHRVALLGVMLLVTVNFFALFNMQSPVTLHGSVSAVGGRTLLESDAKNGLAPVHTHTRAQSDSPSTSHVRFGDVRNTSTLSGDPNVMFNTSRLLEQCAAYLNVNTSDAERLNNELNDLVAAYRGSMGRFGSNWPPAPPSTSQHRRPDSLRYFGTGPAARSRKMITDASRTAARNGDVALYNSEQREHARRARAFDSFLRTIGRRNDTFYVVSFRHDHILVPPERATSDASRSRNNESFTNSSTNANVKRPRMSLLMPISNSQPQAKRKTRTGSARPTADDVTMMQIDCEVFDTKFVTLKAPTFTDLYASRAGRDDVIRTAFDVGVSDSDVDADFEFDANVGADEAHDHLYRTNLGNDFPSFTDEIEV